MSHRSKWLLAAIALSCAGCASVMPRQDFRPAENPHRSHSFEGICNDRLISAGVNTWSSGAVIFDCLATPGWHFSVPVPAQGKSYRVTVTWRGYDKASSTPRGSIDLIANNVRYAGTSYTESGDAPSEPFTYRWQGTRDVAVSAGSPLQLTVHHGTSGSHSGNTYVQIRVVSVAP